MKNLKILSLSVAVASLICLPALAESGAAGKHKGRKGMNLDKMVSKMQDRLELSDDQADKVYGIMKKAKDGRKEKSQECKNLEKFSERSNCRKGSRAGVESEIAAVLTPEQKAKWEEGKKNRKEKGRRKGRKNRKQNAE